MSAQQYMTEIRALKLELDAANKRIDAAPHARHCKALPQYVQGMPTIPGECTCWKSEP